MGFEGWIGVHHLVCFFLGDTGFQKQNRLLLLSCGLPGMEEGKVTPESLSPQVTVSALHSMVRGQGGEESISLLLTSFQLSSSPSALLMVEEKAGKAPLLLPN